MIYFKACPRCRGDMNVVNDLFGKYMECLQCGHEMNIKQPAPATAPSRLWEVPAEKPKAAKAKVKAA